MQTEHDAGLSGRVARELVRGLAGGPDDEQAVGIAVFGDEATRMAQTARGTRRRDQASGITHSTLPL